MTDPVSIYERLAERVQYPTSRLLPELFRMLADEEGAELLLALPATDVELGGRFGMTVPRISEIMGDFYRKGLVFRSVKPEATKYRFCRDVTQLHDASIVWPDATQPYYDLWKLFMAEEWPDYLLKVEARRPRPYTRVIAVNQSISAQSQVLAYENCREMIEGTDRLAVTKCTCRLTTHKCDRPLEVCLQLGKAAAYTIERGSGREVTKDEALKIVRDAEEAGLVHVTMNKSDQTNFLCNCCGCCCMTMPLMIKHGVSMVDPSRFLAVVDANVCTNCGACEERCYFGAILGKDGVATVDIVKCMGCGLCQLVCPSGAISLEEIREKGFIPD